MSDLVVRFGRRFRGNPNRHHVRYRSGATAAKDYPLTFDDMARHLRGEWPSVLITPTDSDGKSFFGVIDIDRHNTPESCDHAAIARQISELCLPLVVCRSTGGKGGWCVLFLREPEGFDSATVRQLLQLYAAQLGVPNSEIFPKQDSTDNYGSPVNLPYFGTERIAFGHHGEQLSLDEFLNYADQQAVWGVIEAQRRFPNSNGGRFTTKRLEKDYEPITVEAAMKEFDDLLEKALLAPEGHRHDGFRDVTYFASRCVLAGIYTEAEIKQRIRDAVKTRFAKHELREMFGTPSKFGYLGRVWTSALRHGPIKLWLYPEDLLALRRSLIADDEIFGRCFDGDTGDFPTAVSAQEYMRQQLQAVGAKHIDRILAASRINDAVAHELREYLRIEQAYQNLKRPKDS